MILDTSALVAILYREPEAADFARLIHDAEVCRISVASYVELSMVIKNQLGPEGMRQAETFLRRAGVVIEPVTVDHGEHARQAFLDFGKGTPQGRLELWRLLLLRAGKGHGRTAPAQGRRFQPDRHKGSIEDAGSTAHLPVP